MNNCITLACRLAQAEPDYVRQAFSTPEAIVALAVFFLILVVVMVLVCRLELKGL